WSGYTYYLRGDLAEAESQLRASLQTLTDWGVRADGGWAPPVLAGVLPGRGAGDEARVVLDGAGDAPPHSDHTIMLDRARTRVLLAEGRPDEPLAHPDIFERHAEGKQHARFVPWRSLKAQALERLDRREEAVAFAEAEVEIARRWGTPGTVGRSLRVLGTILQA